MRNNTLEFSINNIHSFISFFLVAGLVPPDGINTLVPIIGISWKIWHVLACIFIFYDYFIKINKIKKIEYRIIPFILYFFWIFFVTLVGEGEPFRFLTTYIPIVSAILLLELNRGNLKTIIGIIYIYLFILSIVNLICLILYPDGMYTASTYNEYTLNWFLGYKSSLQVYLYPLFIISLLYLAYGKHICCSILTILICLIEPILASNIMLAVIIIFNIIAFWIIKGKKFICFNTIICTASVIFTNLFIVSFSFTEIRFIESFIVDVLNKSTALSGRDRIWEYALYEIDSNFFFGRGILELEDRLGIFGGFLHAHNIFLEVLFEGGIIGFLLFITCFALLLINVSKHECRASRILLLSIFSVFLMGVVEVINHAFYALVWGIMYLSFFCNDIDSFLKEASYEKSGSR